MTLYPLQTHPFECLPFHPLKGFSSPHAQTVLACIAPSGNAPPTTPFIVPLDDGDSLCCEVSIPPEWISNKPTVALIHGLGGNHQSSYMIRITRKLYKIGYRVIRINLRCCGSGDIYATRPYHGGISNDVLSVIQTFKEQAPQSEIILVGFSLGGNIALKLSGELGKEAALLIKMTIGICPPIDLAETASIMALPNNRLYNRYYMHQLERVAKRWLNGRSIANVYEYDNMVTAPQWGFKGAFDYYRQASSRYLLPKIHLPCHILFSEDDPFINYKSCLETPLLSNVKVWISPYGGHMGFFGWSDDEHGYFWLDRLIIKWIREAIKN